MYNATYILKQELKSLGIFSSPIGQASPPPGELSQEAGSSKMNIALEYSTRAVQEGGRRCKKSTLNDLVHLTPQRIPLMNPPKC